MTRFVVLEATLGSAILWSQVGYTLNFCPDTLSEESLQNGHGVYLIARDGFKVLFKTVDVRAKPQVVDELPRYEKVPQVEMPATS